jgi:ATP-dependent RNA helicase RhlE
VHAVRGQASSERSARAAVPPRCVETPGPGAFHDATGRLRPQRSAYPAEQVAASPFTALGIAPALVRAALHEGYVTPTPVQSETIPSVLAGRDVLGCAQTGTGKTAAYLLPMLQCLDERRLPGVLRALVLAPTRELAAQIAGRVTAYGRNLGLEHTVLYGGVSQRGQERELSRKPAVVVATPGRLLDLMRQKLIDLRTLEVLVLDEADTMLDMGFIHDVRQIIAAMPKQRQTLLFSATMPAPIAALSRTILSDPVRVSVTPRTLAAETVEQAVYFVGKPNKRFLLTKMLSQGGIERALVFTRTKHGADRVARQLVQAGVGAAAIHGNKSQNARERALEAFRSGTTHVLVATDIAARGIDVHGITHVINYDLPNVAESYVHRIGRTGRAGAVGRAISFCDQEERGLLLDIERLIQRRIPVASAP